MIRYVPNQSEGEMTLYALLDYSRWLVIPLIFMLVVLRRTAARRA